MTNKREQAEHHKFCVFVLRGDPCNCTFGKPPDRDDQQPTDVQMLQNQVELLEEDLECVHLYLDWIGAPRRDGEGEKYSIVGRIKNHKPPARIAAAKDGAS